MNDSQKTKNCGNKIVTKVAVTIDEKSFIFIFVPVYFTTWQAVTAENGKTITLWIFG